MNLNSDHIVRLNAFYIILTLTCLVLSTRLTPEKQRKGSKMTQAKGTRKDSTVQGQYSRDSTLLDLPRSEDTASWLGDIATRDRWLGSTPTGEWSAWEHFYLQVDGLGGVSLEAGWLGSTLLVFTLEEYTTAGTQAPE